MISRECATKRHLRTLTLVFSLVPIAAGCATAPQPENRARVLTEAPDAARSVCPNYATVMRQVKYPVDVVNRIGQGTVVADFTVRRTQLVEIRIVSASDSGLVPTVEEIIRAFRCDTRTDSPVTYRIPVTFKRER